MESNCRPQHTPMNTLFLIKKPEVHNVQNTASSTSGAGQTG